MAVRYFCWGVTSSIAPLARDCSSLLGEATAKLEIESSADVKAATADVLILGGLNFPFTHWFTIAPLEGLENGLAFLLSRQ